MCRWGLPYANFFLVTQCLTVYWYFYLTRPHIHSNAIVVVIAVKGVIKIEAVSDLWEMSFTQHSTFQIPSATISELVMSVTV